MMKDRHLKMYIDRLMMVPRGGPKAGGSEKPLDHPEAVRPNSETPGEARSLFDEYEGEERDRSGLAAVQGRDTMRENPDIDDRRDDHYPGEKYPTPSPARPHDEENPGQGLEGLLDQKNPGSKSSGGPGKGLHGISGPSKPKPQTVQEPHALNHMDYEKKVMADRDRHRKIFGD